MKRIDKLASDIAREWNDENKSTNTLMKFIERVIPCSMCSYYSKELLTYADKANGEIKKTSCKSIVKINDGDYSYTCRKGVEDYMNQEADE